MTIKGQRLVLPSFRFALLQIGISAANWMVMGAIIWLLLGSEINYFSGAGRAAGEQYRRRYRSYSRRDWRAGGGVYRHALRRVDFEGGDNCRSAGVARAVLFFCRCCWRPSPIWCWRVGRKSCGRRTSASWPADETARLRLPGDIFADCTDW